MTNNLSQKEKMTTQYQDLISAIPVTIDKKEQQMVTGYLRNIKLLKLVTISTLALFLFTVQFKIPGRMLLLLLGILGLFLYFRYRSNSSKLFRDVLLEQCDPAKALSLFMGLYAHTNTKKASVWTINFYNIARILSHLGRLEELPQIQSLLKTYCDTPEGNAYRYAIGADLALHAHDYEALEQCCQKLREAGTSSPLLKSCGRTLKQRIAYPRLLQLYEAHSDTELYQLIETADIPNASLCSEVIKQYALYQIAERAGEKEKAEKHRAFVLENGGTTRYRTELLKDTKEETDSILPS